MTQLPTGWIEAPIDQLCIPTEQVTPDQDATFIYVDIGSVDRATKKVSEPQRLLGKDAPSRARKLIRMGDTIVSTTRPNLNAVALIDRSLDSQIASTGFEVLRSPGLDPRWLGYLVRTNAFIDEMSSLVQGALYPAVRGKDVRSFIAPIAPRNEQKRIADKLDTVLSRVDAVNARLARVAPILKSFRQSVLAAATSGTLTEDWRGANQSQPGVELLEALLSDHEAAGGKARGNASEPTKEAHDLTAEDVPEDWGIGTLGDCCTPGRPITYGILKPGPELNVGIPYIRVADFPGNRLNLNGIRKTSPDIDLQYKRSRLLPGDLLLSIRGSVGRLIEIPPELENANITQDTARLSISSRLNSRFIYYSLLSPDALRRMGNAIRGVAVRGINIGDVRALQVPIPSAQEQAEIVRRVDTLFAFADRIEARLQTAQVATERLTPSLLAKAFRGELVPQDPNDEPASELLRRLAQTSPAGTSRGRRKAVATT